MLENKKMTRVFYTLLYFLIFGFILNSSRACGETNYTQEKIQEKFIQAGETKLFCRWIGNGNPLIVLHGGAGYLTQDYLLPHMTRLAKDNLVVFYDQRGLGRSTCDITPEQINLKIYIEDIETVRRFLGVKKMSILGHSWGSFLGLHYALAHPESIDKLILLSSMPVSSGDLGLFFKELQNRLAPYQETLQKIETSDLYLIGDPKTIENQQRIIFQTYMCCPENIQKLNLWKSKQESLNGFKVWEIFKEQIFMKPYNLLQDLSTLQCPTLLIHGDVDVIPFVSAENIQAAIPFSKLIKIKQCGHFPFVEQPEICFQSINDFLN